MTISIIKKGISGVTPPSEKPEKHAKSMAIAQEYGTVFQANGWIFLLIDFLILIKSYSSISVFPTFTASTIPIIVASTGNVFVSGVNRALEP